MATENDIALGVMRIADAQTNGIATYPRLKREISALVPLSAQNTAPSGTRNGEPMWHQLLRNIKSHSDADGNYIAIGYLRHIPRRGYEITRLGRARLRALGL